jgi:hypothetical protein
MYARSVMETRKRNRKQNVVVRLDRQTIQEAKIIAARRSMSIGDLLAQQIEILVRKEEAYARAQRQALIFLDRGFHLGGAIPKRREVTHER